jgi:hypothetical protein
MRAGGKRLAVVLVAAVALGAAAAPGSATPGPNERLTSADGPTLDRLDAPNGDPANATVYLTDLSADGSRVVVDTSASNLVAGSPAASNVLSWDRPTDVVGILSRTDGGLPYTGGCFDGASAVAGGVAFLRCAAPGLLPTPVAGTQAWVRDAGGARVASLVDVGEEDPDVPIPGGTGEAAISESGGLVAFSGHVDDQIHLRDVGDEETVVVSRTPEGDPGNGESHLVAIDDAGTAVLFHSDSTDLVAGGVSGMYVHDVGTGEVDLVSVSTSGDGGDAGLYGDISAGGRYVVFSSFSNLVPGDTSGRHVFLRDRMLGTTEMISVTPEGGPAGGQSYEPAVSDDGRYVAFRSTAQDLGPGPAPSSQIYRHDRVTGETVRVSQRPDGTPADDYNREPLISADGSVVAFESSGDNLLPGDEQDVTQVLVWEAGDATPVCDFPDVPPGHTFRTEICWAVAQGITTGYGDGTFRPTVPISRQALVVFLWRLEGEPSGPFPHPTLRDVPMGEPFHTAISWAIDEGIVAGYADGTFRPTASVSRQAMVVFLWRLSGSPTVGFPAATFPDLPGGTFGTAISWAVDEEITNGYADGTFKPTAPVSRQAGVAFIHRWVP